VKATMIVDSRKLRINAKTVKVTTASSFTKFFVLIKMMFIFTNIKTELSYLLLTTDDITRTTTTHVLVYAT